MTLETGSGNPVNMIGANNLNWSAQVGAAERNNGTFLFGLGSGQASSAARGGPQILSGILSAAAQSVPALATWNEDYDEDLKYTVGNPLASANWYRRIGRQRNVDGNRPHHLYGRHGWGSGDFSGSYTLFYTPIRFCD